MKSSDMEVKEGHIPPGPLNKFRVGDDLLNWMGCQFELFGDIFKASVYDTSIYAVRDIDFAYHVLVHNWQNYVKGQAIKRVALLLGNGLMVSKGDVWKRQRRMIQPTFNHETIGRSAKLITAVNANLLKKWQSAVEKGESVNVTRDVSCMALEVILRFILSDDYERVGFHFGLLSSEPSRNMEFVRSFRALGKIIVQVIDRRRQSSETVTDALSMLMQARDPQTGESMPDSQLVDEILTMIVAGHDTTASTLNWAWYLISQHPAVEEKLSNELLKGSSCSEAGDLVRFCYTRQVLDETMRLYPAGWVLTRKALHDDQFGEYVVPAGTEIYIAPYFIQRHPKLWEEPDRFDPDRFRPGNSKSRHRLATIPFSTGPRNCIGEHFARLEMQIHLMTNARCLRLRYIPSGPVEVEAEVNLRSKQDFLMYPEFKNGNS
jgi:cytochrome P450